MKAERDSGGASFGMRHRPIRNVCSANSESIDCRRSTGPATAGCAALAGEGVYTTGDIRARPDKQGAKWQTGTGLNSLWTRVYAELDRLEACRDAQPAADDSLPEPTVETVDGTPPLSEYNDPPQAAQGPARLPLVVSHGVERLVGYCTSNPSVCTPGIARKVIHRRALSVSVGLPGLRAGH